MKMLGLNLKFHFTANLIKTPSFQFLKSMLNIAHTNLNIGRTNLNIGRTNLNIGRTNLNIILISFDRVQSIPKNLILTRQKSLSSNS